MDPRISAPGTRYALSRSPVQDPENDDEIGEDPTAPALCSIIAVEVAETHPDLRLEEVRSAAAWDPELQALQEVIRNGFPDAKVELPELVRPYWPVRERLSVDDGLAVCGCRLIIPGALRRQVLESLHDGHLGRERTKARARQIVFWPGLDRDIENVTRNCRKCQRELPSQQKETLAHRPPAARPFQHLNIDLAEHAGNKYLVAVDGFSGWRFVEPLGKSAPTRRLTGALRSIFCRVGVPDTIWTDGGPQFTSSSFRLFNEKWGIIHHKSSPHYPQANGRAEAAVKSAKKLLRRCWDDLTGQLDDEKWTRGVLQHRNTPGPSGRSPAQVVFGRPMRDTIPAHRRNFAPEWQRAAEDAEAQAASYQEKVEVAYNQTARDLPELSVGNQVAVQDHRTGRWDRYGVIADVGPYRRYYVRLAGGRVLVRNRRHIRRRYGHATPDPSPAAEDRRGAPSDDRRTTPATSSGPSLSSRGTVLHAPPPLRRSERVRRPPRRLIEEI